MRHLVRLTLTGLIVSAATLIVAAPASAAELPSRSIAVPASSPSQPVTGLSWSSPTYPVDCEAASGQISCTPTDPADVRAQEARLADGWFNTITAEVFG